MGSPCIKIGRVTSLPEALLARGVVGEEGKTNGGRGEGRKRVSQNNGGAERGGGGRRRGKGWKTGQSEGWETEGRRRGEGSKRDQSERGETNLNNLFSIYFPFLLPPPGCSHPLCRFSVSLPGL